ncbi:MAG: glycoside hydrolase family 25 protein [Actinomycetota bacterium]|nr:glycoside hydrolase family 25 protein [Actinomycetota bacterium]
MDKARQSRSSPRALIALAIAACSFAAAISMGLPSIAGTSTYTAGIDVSHYQGTNIRWGKVARSKHVFAYQKATEGTSFTDPTYASNRERAGARGVTFGAYHFSNPRGSTRAAALAEARREADHFIDTAQPAPGDLVPALDIEYSSYTQTMGTPRLIKWIDAWLREVEARVGVKPVIYTSPYFWKVKFTDTTRFAREGYGLWIAHWTTRKSGPTVPADNWGGRGWTFWQWTNCGSVPGIQGCVDEDRYNGSDLSLVTIPGSVPSPTPTPTTSVSIAPSSSTSPIPVPPSLRPSADSAMASSDDH